MFGGYLFFILAVILNSINLFGQVFFSIMYNDLESDYINPMELCNKLNQYIVPEGCVHLFLSVLLLIKGHWITFLINLPLLAYNANKFYKKKYLLDATDIFRTLSSHKIESFVKLFFHFIMFFYYLYRMVFSLITEDV
ncbi:hypothetical protein PACTADRAFT_61965 [Pachysolen tannophilus NRRL Y-2460]|uniref:ER-derived vesicles protein ERV14 n=1 Tax=Pachysolen tannophilus NRRL Y-2460 TaxID=669874 RepID=A0A1E4TNK5_PACTA|nr:hypothetical protein PACTADRAFT_61965 [Pachysolen tannophilus NRRL Y-2460]